MDVTMGKKTVVCYNKIFEYADVCEGAVELVVPDTMPDIERILCADGTLVIRSKEASMGSVSVTAGIAASVLYVPEEEQGVRCLNTAIPFTVTAEAPGITPETVPVVMLSIASIEAHMLNPRKVAVRASVEMTIECHDHTEAEYCSEIDGDGAGEIQTLLDSRTISHVVCAQEKTFVMKDEFRIPAGMPDLGDILGNVVELSANEIRAVGSKLVINGSAEVGLIYTVAGSSDIASVRFETSFSQIIETDQELAAPDCRASMLLTALFIEPYTFAGGERGVACELHIVAQVVCSDNVKIGYISDCYSNRSMIGVSRESKQAVCDIHRDLLKCNLHEQIETPHKVGEVNGFSCRVTDIKMESGIVKCMISTTILYSDDTGTIYCTSRRFPFECSADQEGNTESMVISARCSQIFATPADKSIDFRAQVCFEVMMYRLDTIVQIAGISYAEGTAGCSDLPSLIVVRAGENATLWQMAKRYHSTCELISMVNHLESGEPIAGKTLLIPAVK